MTRSIAHHSPFTSWEKAHAGEASLGLFFTSARCSAGLNQQRSWKQSHCPCLEAPSNSGVKLSRPGFGPAAELPISSPA